MQLQIEHVGDIEAAKRTAGNYQYALLNRYSDVLLSETKDIHEMRWEECMEARFFDGNKELRFFRDGDVLFATIVSGDEDVVESRYSLDKRFQSLGSNVKVRQFLKYDEDGQAFVAATMLVGLER